MHLTLTLKCNMVLFIRKEPNGDKPESRSPLLCTDNSLVVQGHLVMHRQVSRSPCNAQTTPPLLHGDQPESQRSSKPSDMPPSTSIPTHEKLQVLTDKVHTIFVQYEV